MDNGPPSHNNTTCTVTTCLTNTCSECSGYYLNKTVGYRILCKCKCHGQGQINFVPSPYFGKQLKKKEEESLGG
jgi:hypothetical protein